MTILNKIKKFLFNVTDVSICYNKINFIQPANLDEEQIGYNFDSNGNSLITGMDGGWREEWLVIGTDQLGDLVIIDVSSPKLTVLCAAYGEESWESFVIANSLDNFMVIISALHKITKNRNESLNFEKDPVTDQERKNILTKIEQENPDVEMWFWENFLKNIYDNLSN